MDGQYFDKIKFLGGPQDGIEFGCDDNRDIWHYFEGFEIGNCYGIRSQEGIERMAPVDWYMATQVDDECLMLQFTVKPTH